MLYRVVVAHLPEETGPGGPLRLRAGERLTLSGAVEERQGYAWLRAEDGEGRAGWVPSDLVEASAGARGSFEARRAYSAAELACEVAEQVVALFASHGRAWCAHPDGRAGWVPLGKLAPIAAGA